MVKAIEPQKVIHIVPGHEPFEVYMFLDLDTLQRFVGGFVESVTVDNDTVVLCNEDGKYRGLEPNFVIDYGQYGCDIIVGSAIICGYKADEFCSINEQKKDEILKSLTSMNKIEVKR